MEFFGEAPIVAHNAEFDRAFLNAELALLGRTILPKERFIDTLVLAREHRPGSPASLDAVCKRFNISIEGRELHGALKDARLLAMAYLELRGGRERAFDFAAATIGKFEQAAHTPRPSRPGPLVPRISAEERDAHAAFLAELGEDAIWKKYA
jgi:DNA polymerase-3 subunit epsilon